MACLDVPSKYESEGTLQAANIMLVRENGDISRKLQVASGEKYSLYIETIPLTLKTELSCSWYSKGILLQNGCEFHGLNAYPDSLVLTDKALNSFSKSFSIIQNTAPTFEKIISPKNGETFIGYKNTPFKFEWAANDIDNDKLTYILEIDGVQYSTGIWPFSYQTNILAGKHSFRVIVSDSHDTRDSSETGFFFVNLLEEQ